MVILCGLKQWTVCQAVRVIHMDIIFFLKKESLYLMLTFLASSGSLKGTKPSPGFTVSFTHVKDPHLPTCWGCTRPQWEHQPARNQTGATPWGTEQSHTPLGARRQCKCRNTQAPDMTGPHTHTQKGRNHRFIRLCKWTYRKLKAVTATGSGTQEHCGIFKVCSDISLSDILVTVRSLMKLSSCFTVNWYASAGTFSSGVTSASEPGHVS